MPDDDKKDKLNEAADAADAADAENDAAKEEPAATEKKEESDKPDAEKEVKDFEPENFDGEAESEDENPDEEIPAELGNDIEEAGQPEPPVEEYLTRYCPCCYYMPMTKMGAAGGKIQIDVCNNCGGKFLDYGELEKIRNTEITQNEIMNEFRQMMQIQADEMESINRLARFMEIYRKIVPWHKD